MRDEGADDDIEKSSYILRPFTPFNKSSRDRRPYESGDRRQNESRDRRPYQPRENRQNDAQENRQYDAQENRQYDYRRRDKFQREESSEYDYPRRPYTKKPTFDREQVFKKTLNESEVKPVISNPIIGRFERLISSKKFRDQENSIVVPGLVALQACEKDSIKTILSCSKEAVEKFSKLVDFSRTTRVEYIKSSQMNDLINEKNPDAIVAEVAKPELSQFNQEILQIRKRWIAVNGVRDGANLGLLIRAAGCLNWDGVIIVGNGNVDPFNMHTIRASTGAVFKVPIFVSPDFESLGNAQIVLGEIPTKAQESSELDFDKPIVLVIGGEQEGHRQLPDNITHYMSIPTAASFGSLNAAVAGAIMMSSINQNISKIN